MKKKEMMKKLMMTLMMVITFSSAAFADKYVHNDSVLPVAAKSVLKKNFKADVSLVKIDRTLGHINEYEVILTDGSEISFDSKGNWKDVEVAANKSVPQGFVLQPMRDYVKRNHGNAKIIGIEKDSRNIEVTLSNGIEMKFSHDGKFERYDD